MSDQPPRRDVIEPMVRGLYRIVAMRRDIQRRALPKGALGRLTTMGTLYRLGPTRVSDVAEDLHIDCSVASRQVNALAAAGLVRREPDPLDGRAQVIHLTDEGRAELTDGWQAMVDAVADAVAGWSDADIERLATDLVRLSEDAAAALAGSGGPVAEEPGEARA
jgi:DNA-binding MarR family transcriptional regulator